MSSSGHEQLLGLFIPSDHEQGHEHIRRNPRLQDLIRVGKDLRRTNQFLRESGYECIDHHHDESGRDSVPRDISDIRVIILSLLDHVIAVAPHFGGAFRVRDDADGRDVRKILRECVLLDFRGQLDFGFQFLPAIELFLEVLQDLDAFIEEADDVIECRMAACDRDLLSFLPSCEEFDYFSPQLIDRVDDDRIDKEVEEQNLHRYENRPDDGYPVFLDEIAREEKHDEIQDQGPYRDDIDCISYEPILHSSANCYRSSDSITVSVFMQKFEFDFFSL